MPGALRAVRPFELVVVRHGRTAWNADGRFQGHTDVPLDATGREQARALAATLRGERFDALVASDLSRARETAEAIAQGRATSLAVDVRWREMGFGAWEGLTWEQIVAREPALAGRSLTEPRGYVPPHGESFAVVCERVAEALLDIAATAPDGGRVLVATHAGPLHALLRIALGETAAAAVKVRFTPASVTRLAFDRAGARVVELNATVDARAAGDGAERG